MTDPQPGEAWLVDLTAAVHRAVTALTAAQPALDAGCDATLDQINRMSRARFARVPGALSDEEYYAPFPHLTGDVE